MTPSIKFWLGVAVVDVLASWLFQIPVWVFPAVAVTYVLILLGIELQDAPGITQDKAA